MDAATPFVAATAVAGVTCPPVVYLSWKRRDVRGAVALGALMACAFVWIAVNVTAMAVVQLPLDPGGFAGLDTPYDASLAVQRLAYFGITTTVLAWFAFTAEYTGRDWLVTPKSLAVLAVEPIAINAVIWLAPDLVWAKTAVTPATATGVTITEYGLAFWLHAMYSYVLIFAGASFLVGMLIHSQRRYRWQGFAVLAAAVAPLVGNLLYISGTVPTDLSPAGFAVFGAGFAFATFRYEVMDLTPVARDTVVDRIDDGVLVVDADDRVVDMNATSEAWLDVDSDDAVGIPVASVLEAYPTLVDAYDDVITNTSGPGDDGRVDVEASMRETGIEVTLETDDGTRHFEVHSSPIAPDSERTVGRVILVHDVTTRKRRQRELERQNEQLDEFASMVSHDLQNPLARARSRLDLLRRSRDGDHGQQSQDDALDHQSGDAEHLDEIDTALQSMDALIDDLLALAQHGRDVGETHPVALEPIARAAIAVLETQPAVSFEGELPTVESDPGRVQQLFENLFANAVDHAGSDVTVRVGPLEDDRGFYVADDGPGIDPRDHDRVFDSGFTGSDDGTGIGLAIVESVAAAHGWTVTVTDSWAGGARFEISTDGADEHPREPSPTASTH